MPSDAPPSPAADAAVIGDLVARDRRSPAPALRAAEGRSHSYRDFVTTSYKAGNVLRYLGVRPGDDVAVASDPAPEPVLAFYGAAQLGAVTAFGPDPEAPSPRATLVAVERESAFDPPPGHELAVYGGSPDRPTTTHWEQELWSENPAVHPVDVSPADAALRADGRAFTHRTLLDAAAAAVETAAVAPGDEVVVRGSLDRPGVVAAGLLAPILAGAVIVFPREGTVGDVAVGTGPEPRTVRPEDVL